MVKEKINFKKSYSREVFSLEGKKIFSTFLFLSFLLLIFFFLFVSCQNGFCPKKISSFLEKGITGKVVSSQTDFNSVEFLEEKIVASSNFSGETVAVSGNILAVANGDSISIFEKSSSGGWVKKTTLYRDSVDAEVSSLENKLEVLSNGRPIGEGKIISQGFGKTVSLSGDYLLSGGFVFKRDAQGNWNQEFIQREGYVFYGLEEDRISNSFEPFFFRYIYNSSLSYLNNYYAFSVLKGRGLTDRLDYRPSVMDPFFVKFPYEKEFLEEKEYASPKNFWRPFYFIKENVFIDGYFGSVPRNFMLSGMDYSTVMESEEYFENIFLTQPIFMVGDLIVSGKGTYKKNEGSGYWERKSKGIKNIFSVSGDLVFSFADGDKNISVYKKNSADGFDFFYSIPLEIKDDFGNSVSESNNTLLVGLPKKKYYSYCDNLISYPYTSLFSHFGLDSNFFSQGKVSSAKKTFYFFKKVSYECERPLLVIPISEQGCPHSSEFVDQLAYNPEIIDYLNSNKLLYLPGFYNLGDLPVPEFTIFPIDSYFQGFRSVFDWLYRNEEEYYSSGSGGTFYSFISILNENYSKSYPLEESAIFQKKDSYFPGISSFLKDFKLLKSPSFGTFSLIPGPSDYRTINGIIWKKSGYNIPEEYYPDKYISILETFKPSGGWDEVSPIKKPNPSAAYFYIKDSLGKFTNPKKIAPANLEQNERFASSVSISGDYAVIGSTRDVGSSLPGNFYVYKKDNSGNWNLLSKVSSPIVDPSFGKTILIKDNLIFVGSNKNLYIYQLVYRSSDNVPPTLAVSNYSGHYSFGLNLNAFASDESGISSWSLSGSSLFSINQSGNIKNISTVSAGTYFLNVSVLDNEGNIASKIIKVELLSSPVCGDSACMDGETCSNCAYDCGACPNLFLQDYSEPIVVDYSNATEYIKIGYSFYLSEGDSVNFSFENKKYSLVLNEYDSFEFELFSTEGNKNKILTFNLEEEIEKNIDLEGDDDLDLNLFLSLLGEENILELSMHFIDNFYSDSDSSIFSDTEETEEFEDDDENEEEEESSSGNTEVETSQTSSNTSTPAKNSSNKKEEDSFDILPTIILSIVLLFFSIFIIYLFLLKKKEDAEKNKVKNDVSFKDNSLRDSKKNIFPVNKSFLSNKQNLRRNL